MERVNLEIHAVLGSKSSSSPGSRAKEKSHANRVKIAFLIEKGYLILI